MRRSCLVLIACCAACVDLPDMPEAAERPDWACEQEMDERIERCLEGSCDGFLIMDALVDELQMPLDSEDIEATVIHDDDGTVDGISMRAIAPYFRGTLDIQGLDFGADDTHLVYGVSTPHDAQERINTASLVWSISNSDDPLVVVASRGILQVTRADAGYETVWIVGDASDTPVKGCAFFRYDL